MESKVKDTTFCKSTGKSEWNTSNLAMIRSLTIPMASSAIKESDDFKNRVRRNNDAKDYLHNMKYNQQILTSNFERRDELTRVPRSDIEYSKMILSKESYYHTKCQ